MSFETNIPIDQIRVGDHFDAEIDCLVDRRPIWRRCKLVSIHGKILRVTTATRKGVVMITRDKIRSDHAWGER